MIYDKKLYSPTSNFVTVLLNKIVPEKKKYENIPLHSQIEGCKKSMVINMRNFPYFFFKSKQKKKEDKLKEPVKEFTRKETMRSASSSKKSSKIGRLSLKRENTLKSKNFLQGSVDCLPVIEETEDHNKEFNIDDLKQKPSLNRYSSLLLKKLQSNSIRVTSAIRATSASLNRSKITKSQSSLSPRASPERMPKILVRDGSAETLLTHSILSEESEEGHTRFKSKIELLKKNKPKIKTLIKKCVSQIDYSFDVEKYLKKFIKKVNVRDETIEEIAPSRFTKFMKNVEEITKMEGLLENEPNKFSEQYDENYKQIKKRLFAKYSDNYAYANRKDFKEKVKEFIQDSPYDLFVDANKIISDKQEARAEKEDKYVYDVENVLDSTLKERSFFIEKYLMLRQKKDDRFDREISKKFFEQHQDFVYNIPSAKSVRASSVQLKNGIFERVCRDCMEYIKNKERKPMIKFKFK